MKTALLVAFALLFIGALSGLAWRRIKGRGKNVDLVAKSNHKSVWSFHYGPASVLPIRETAKVAAPKAAESPLTQLIAEDIEAKEEQVKAEEEARVEEAQVFEKEGQPRVSAQPDEADYPAAESVVSSMAANSSERENDLEKESPPVQLLSSRHASGAQFNVLDILGTDEAAANNVPATAAAEVKPVIGEEPTEAAGAPTEEDTVPQTLYANALTEATRTKNDEANRKAAVALKQRNRAALRTGTDGQKAALAALIPKNTAPG